MPAANACSQNLIVRRRADLVTSLQWQRGERVYVVKDPLALKYYRFSQREYAILQLTDRPISPAAIAARLARDFPAAPPTVEEVQKFVASLYHHALVVSDGSGQGPRLLQRRQAQRSQQRRRLITNVLSMRTPGIDPTKLLDVLYPLTGWFFGPRALVAVALLTIVALTTLVTSATRLPSELVSMHAWFGAGNWLLLALTFAITKMLHELGHALACRRCGGECHEIGVMFLVLTPCLYCDVSDSWMLPSKWQRAGIAAAGMYVEVMLAAIATLVWAGSEAGTLHYLALQVIFVCGVSTVLFNGNPLARYDGYHILADLVEIPNLRDQARAALAARLWRLIGIVRQGAPHNPSWKLTLFGLAVTLYRWLLLATILWGLHLILAPRGLEVAWQFIFVAVVLSVVLLPAVRLVRALRRKEVIQSMNHRRVMCAAGGLMGAAAVFVAVPLPYRVHSTFETRYAGAVHVYAPLAATLERVAAPGDAVRKGQVIAELRSVDLELEIARLRAAVAQHARDVATLQYERFRDPQAIEATGQAKELLAAAREKLAEREADQAKLQIVAPCDGIVLPPPQKSAQPGEATLATWTGTPLDERNARAPLAPGDVICELGDPARLVAVLIADQAGVERLRPGQTVELVLDAQPLQIYRGEIAEISLDTLPAMPEGMSVHAGGQVPSRSDSAGVDRPASPSYSVIVPLSFDGIPHAAGLRGSARIDTGRETLALRAWRYVCRTFRFEW